MPSEFSRSPRLLKGALAIYPSQAQGTQPRIVPFQYNPEQVRRSIVARTSPPERGNAGQAREEALRVFGPPTETITLTIVLSAIDALEDPDNHENAKKHGVHPMLATLEMLMYPSTETQQQQREQASQGQVQVAAADLPMALLVWGESRVAPVQITSYSATEEQFDVNLNPIQAKVELSLKVLTTMELQDTSIGYDAFLAYQRQKEQLAQKEQAQGDASRIRGWLPS